MNEYLDPNFDSQTWVEYDLMARGSLVPIFFVRLRWIFSILGEDAVDYGLLECQRPPTGCRWHQEGA